MVEAVSECVSQVLGLALCLLLLYLRKDGLEDRAEEQAGEGTVSLWGTQTLHQLSRLSNDNVVPTGFLIRSCPKLELLT